MSEASLNSLIVRNIRDIEAAYFRAENEIQDVLAKEVSNIFKTIADRVDWQCSPDVDLNDLWLARPEWISDEDNKNKKYNLKFKLSYSEEGSEITWLSVFCGVNDAKLYLIVYTDINTSWKKIINSFDDEKRELLHSAGFVIYPKFITRYINIDHEKLVLGFQNDDISEALEPIGQALQAAFEAREVFNPIVKEVRDNAK